MHQCRGPYPGGVGHAPGCSNRETLRCLSSHKQPAIHGIHSDAGGMVIAASRAKVMQLVGDVIGLLRWVIFQPKVGVRRRGQVFVEFPLACPMKLGDTTQTAVGAEVQ